MFNLKLKQLREAKNISQKQLASILLVSQSTVGNWEAGTREPSFEMVEALADFFNVSIDYLLGREIDGMMPHTSNGVLIPILGEVAAGIPVTAVEEILGYEEITPQMAAQGEHFALKIKGDSMEPKFSNGDIVIVRQQEDVDTGEIAVVLVNSEEATVKKVKKEAGGLMLIPTNPAFEPRFFTNSDVKKLPVIIVGRVVELRAKF